MAERADPNSKLIAENRRDESGKVIGARFVVRAGRSQTVEGTSRSRNVVLEFPSYEAAVECWHSPEYAAALALRRPVSTADVLIIEGYDGPQP